jgi:quinohemoprotein ethanol dehydrogenase
MVSDHHTSPASLRRLTRTAILAQLLLLFSTGVLESRASDADERAAGAPPVPADDEWPAYGRNADEQHYSALRSIDAANIDRLGLLWALDLPIGNAITQPVEARGKVFVASGHSLVSALDAVNGKLLWRYDSKAAERSGYKLRETYGSRGLAYADGRVYVGTTDGRLVALDADSGRVAWSVLTTLPGDLRFISGAPRAFAGKVIIGHGGSDLATTRGYVTCYDAKTGRLLWRFYFVPGNPAKGSDGAASDSIMPMIARTWHGEWWSHGGGGATAWNAITYDPEFNRFYIGTGNAFAVNRIIRSEGRGDNLFVASIVAVDADTGHYVWHYQVNPGDQWDYDACDDLTLATLSISGAPRKVLMQASKNGFFYVIDRSNGALISAEPFAKATWAARIDTTTGRPVETPEASYHGRLVELWPSLSGAHNWLPQSFNPSTGLMYLPVLERGMIIGDQGLDLSHWEPPSHAIGTSGITGDFFPNLPGARRSYLKAWDPVAQKLRWSHETPGDWPGGILSTAGNLVFQGRIDHQFVAYAADSGKILWSFDARSPIVSPPITYAVDNRQFVTVVTGTGASGGSFSAGTARYGIDYFSMPRRVLTFALDAQGTLPPAPPPLRLAPPNDPTYRRNEALEGQGVVMYHKACGLCHGALAVAAGSAPDLRLAAVTLDRASFEAILRQGQLVPQGMPQFADLSVDDIESIRQYVRSRGQAIGKPDASPAASEQPAAPR